MECPEWIISFECVSIIRFWCITFNLWDTFIKRLCVISKLSSLISFLILRQVSKIYVIFAFHFICVPQKKQVIFNQIQLNVLLLTIFKFGNRNNAKSTFLCHYKSEMITRQEENVACFPIWSYQKQILDIIICFFDFDEVVMAYYELEENLWFNCFSQSLLLYQLNLLF